MIGRRPGRRVGEIRIVDVIAGVVSPDRSPDPSRRVRKRDPSKVSRPLRDGGTTASANAAHGPTPAPRSFRSIRGRAVIERLTSAVGAPMSGDRRSASAAWEPAAPRPPEAGRFSIDLRLRPHSNARHRWPVDTYRAVGIAGRLAVGAGRPPAFRPSRNSRPRSAMARRSST